MDSEIPQVNGTTPPATNLTVNAPSLNGHTVTADVDMNDANQELKPNGSHAPSHAPQLDTNPAAPANSNTSTQPAGSLAPHLGSFPRATASPRASTPAAPAPTQNPQSAEVPSAIIPSSVPHGSPARQYVNQKITPALLEGMKIVTMQQPEKPLQWLGEFLLKKSQELEGS